MDPKILDYKIDKYTYKLKSSTTKYEAKIYQNKLRFYHKIKKDSMLSNTKCNVQSGGKFTDLSDISDL